MSSAREELKQNLSLNKSLHVAVQESKEGISLVPEIIEQFLESMKAKGRVKGTLEWYRRGLCKLYDELPEDRIIRHGTLNSWREKLIEDKYSASTINTYIVAANGYLDFIGARDYQLVDKIKISNNLQPELSRTEYLRLLSAARSLGRDQVYFYVKLFTNTALPVQDLNKLTVNAVQEGYGRFRRHGTDRLYT